MGQFDYTPDTIHIPTKIYIGNDRTPYNAVSQTPRGMIIYRHSKDPRKIWSGTLADAQKRTALPKSTGR
jgi:hypothetical protein